ncbi:MAG: C40 family peptidase [Rhizobiales bacterium]|nr:C40 family peptidase [Hyphomicrobiales bacterium]NRB15048.1 C40 family peptidase [Hyphomicrobiales bacterium]
MNQIIYDYIGMPWQLGGHGDGAFDCWGLCRHVWKTHFKIDVPLMPVEATSRQHYALKFRHEMNRMKQSFAAWIQVYEPQNGDAVLMAMFDGHICHIGVYFDLNDGGVLHAIEGGGTQFSSFKQLENLGFKPKVILRYERNI